MWDANILDNLDNINWRPVYTDAGRLARSAAWYTKQNCSCEYRYYGTSYKPNDFTDWMETMADGLSKQLKLDAELNSCNFNRYVGGHQSVSWHADDEQLFHTADGKTTIVSVSFGATRVFGVKKHWQLPKDAKTIELEHGNVLVMAGRTQLHWQHALLPSPPVIGSPLVRYNATFRFISKHNRRCKCKH